MTHGGTLLPSSWEPAQLQTGDAGLKLSPWGRERQKPQGFALEPAGLGLQKAFGKRFGKPLSSPRSLSTRQRQPIFSILPGGNWRHWILKEQPTASPGGFTCPPWKHHWHRAPHLTRDTLHVKAKLRRCGSEGPTPLTRIISPPSSP